MSFTNLHPPKPKPTRPRVMVLSEEPEHQEAAVRQLEHMGYDVSLVPLVCSGVVHRYYREDGTRDQELIAHHIRTSDLLSPFFKPLHECAYAVHDEASLLAALGDFKPDIITLPSTLAGDAFPEGAQTVKRCLAAYAPETVLALGNDPSEAVLQATSATASRNR